MVIRCKVTSSKAAAGNSDDVESEGGNTSAKSGNAYGGDGGDATAKGGNATAGNIAVVKQHNYSENKGCGCEPKKDQWSKDEKSKFDWKPNGGGSGSEQDNDSDIDQGDNEANGGDPKAYGGDGGDAETGNEQKFNGNAISWPSPFRF